MFSMSSLRIQAAIQKQASFHPAFLLILKDKRAPDKKTTHHNGAPRCFMPANGALPGFSFLTFDAIEFRIHFISAERLEIRRGLGLRLGDHHCN
jgi:hypothetical protein